MWKKVSNFMFALALTVPMSVTVVHAQNSQDADIWSYSQDLAMRIQTGRQTGQLKDAEYNSLNTLYNQIESIRRQYSNKKMGDAERNAMMASMTNLDKQLTDYLHDDQLSHYKNWDPAKRSWTQNWWTGNNSYNDELDAYQRSLKDRMDRGRASGQLTGPEFNRLNSIFSSIDAAQRQYGSAGVSNWERNALMTQLTQLDRDITKQLRDNDQSRFGYWNANNNSWSQNWWKPGFNSNSVGSSVNTGNANFNHEIDSYQRDLKDRIDRGRSSGALTPAEFNRLIGAYGEIDRTQQQFRTGGFNLTERNSLMSSLTQLDRDITLQLKDNDRSHYSQWDPKKNTWNQSWWNNNNNNWNNNNNNNWNSNNGGPNSAQSQAFNTEVNEEQQRVKELLVRGQRNGKLTAQEVADLNRQFTEIDQLQAQYRRRGFSRTERDQIMQKLQVLKASLTTNLRDQDRNTNWRQDNIDARNERKGNRWNDNRDRSNSTVTNPNTTPAVPVPPPSTGTNQSNQGDRDRDGRRRWKDRD